VLAVIVVLARPAVFPRPCPEGYAIKVAAHGNIIELDKPGELTRGARRRSSSKIVQCTQPDSPVHDDAQLEGEWQTTRGIQARGTACRELW
jgi:hypothetical protein